MCNPTPDLTGMGPHLVTHALIGWTDQLQRTADVYRSLHHQLSQLAVTETSTDGMVRVSVDAHGVPIELALTGCSRGVDPARLSAELMTCLRRAHSTLATQVQDLVAASVPDGDHDAAAAIVASYHSRFAGLVENPPSLPARPAGRGDDDLSPPPCPSPR